MEQSSNQLTLLKDIVDRLSVGIFVVNQQNELVLWNGYMENYSQTKAEDVVGKNIFEAFPDLPRSWLEQKIHNVFVIKNFSFTSWEHRPYLFKFLHNRPITGGIDYMRQNCTFLPMKNESGEIEHVCVTLFDVTDTSIYEGMLKNAVRSLAEASNRDGLTNVYNRRFLETNMEKEFSRIKRYGGTLTFIIIDLDHFKAVNDNHGHLAGDEILKIAAKRLAEGLRTADTLSRYGGEEFAVILPETPVEGAKILAQRLCDDLAASPVIYEGKSIRVSASLGVAEFQADMESYEVMIARADEMLYRSKENGRNQVTIYYPEKEQGNNTTNDAEVIEGEVAENPEENLAANIVEPAIEESTSDKTEVSEEVTEQEPANAEKVATQEVAEQEDVTEEETSEQNEVSETIPEQEPEEAPAEEITDDKTPEEIANAQMETADTTPSESQEEIESETESTDQSEETSIESEPENNDSAETVEQTSEVVALNPNPDDESSEEVISEEETAIEETTAEETVTEETTVDEKTVYVTIGSK